MTEPHDRGCTVPECDRVHSGHGFCELHRRRWKKYGDPSVVMPTHPNDQGVEWRFWQKVRRTEGCWIWTAAKSAGYGVMNIDRKTVMAHRLSYEINIGPIPDGLELDHLCRVTDCVNPSHLEPVTHQENLRRSPITPFALASAMTTCRRGHTYTDENTYVSPKGHRTCRTCKVILAELKRSAA